MSIPDEHPSAIHQQQENESDVCEVDLFHPERVAAAREEMPTDDLIERLSSIFQCVGHPTRIRILHALLSAELCVCDIAQVLGISVSAVSHQLRTLRAQRVVRFRRDGKMAYYSIDDDHVRSLFNLGLEHIRHGD